MHDLEGFLFGTKIKPKEFIIDPLDLNTTLNNPDYFSWIRLDQFSMSWLLPSITEQMLGHVANYRSSVEVWSLLEQLFFTRSKASILQLRLLLQTTKKGATSIEEFILKMKTNANALIAASQQIYDDELILYILGGLGPEFDSIVINVTSRDSITLQEVQFMLQTHEMRLESQNALTTTDLSHFAANFVQTQFSPYNFRNYQPNSRGRSSVGGHGYHHSGSVNKLLCQICGKAGHIALKFFHRFGMNFQNSQPSSKGFVGVTTTGSWFLNSGATDHVTEDGKSLNAKTEYSGTSKISIGDGSQLSISHIGNIKLPTSQPLMLRDILLVPSIAKNLISISKFTLENDVIVEFDSYCC